ncbi:response regulator [Streptomyces diastaticus]|uniref:response regulator n=1 Tax=Streptomyces diastaticus TaxID=1956 RepID=UPI0036561038
MSDTSAPPTASEPIRVFILDDHEVVRRGVRDLLEAEEDIVVGEAADARQALARVPAARPQVAVLDVRLGDDAGGDHAGIEVCRELRARMPELVCLMLTSFDDDEALFDAIMAGASGYVLKQINGADLVSAVRTVASGTSMLDPRTTARVMARLRGGPGPGEARPAEPEQPSVLDRLSPREREILELIGEGLTNREIAERLYLAEKTVKNRISAILSKLGVGRRIQAAMIAGRLRERSS